VCYAGERGVTCQVRVSVRVGIRVRVRFSVRIRIWFVHIYNVRTYV
jgi:hypothetical protein